MEKPAVNAALEAEVIGRASGRGGNQLVARCRRIASRVKVLAENVKLNVGRSVVQE